MDTVIKPEDQSNIWEDNVTKLTGWLLQDSILQQIQKHTGLNLEYRPKQYDQIVDHLEIELDDLTLNNLDDNSILPLIVRLDTKDNGMIEEAIHMASVYWSKTVLLVATEFSIAELNTLEWLNANSASNVRFYAFTVDTFKTGEEISGDLTIAAKPEDAMFSELQNEFWKAFAIYELEGRQKNATEDDLRLGLNEHLLTSSNSVFFGSFRLPFRAIFFFDPKNNTIAVGTRISSAKKAEEYHELTMDRKEQLEKAFPSNIKLEYTYKAPYDI